jgi:hypothetical protein
VPFHALVPQVQLLRRPCDKEEPVVGDGRLVKFGGGYRTDARRLQADPPQAVARHGRLVRKDLEPVPWLEQAAEPQPFFSRHLPLLEKS